MSLKDNTVEQKIYLEATLEQVNTVVSAILGYRIKLKIEEIGVGNKKYFKVADNSNIRKQCGVMAKAFKEVTINSYNMYWIDNGIGIDLCFHYKHIDGGSNSAKFCRINIIDGLVTISED